ncbi:hypothetical protein [Brevibacillus sp. SYSU BS000544]|uniref:hypothetical protein n=1 Tax=Brevibacillus sp. SYSU BS000544 TaxID=3416443 RepID=UPI003CE550A1
MSKNKAMVSLFVTVLLAGCMTKPAALPTTEPAQPTTTLQTTAEQTTSTAPPQQENQEEIQIVPKPELPQPVTIPAKEIPYAYENMKEDVLIQLDEEPRLHSPIRTVVATTPQKYTLFFRQAMDPASVESAIKANTDMKEDHQASEKRPSFTFTWTSDRQLHLIVEVPELQQPEYGHQYDINVKGAKTKKGQILQEPPTFLATLYTQPQLWRISSDGKRAEQVTNEEEPYHWNQVGLGNDRYALLYRYTKYCECDAIYPKLHAVYDFETDQLTKYPVELMTHYLGEGEFFADTRGFFYHKPAKGVTMPASDTVTKIKMDGFVHGANFSKKRTHLFLAVGTKEQQKDYDLVIIELATQKQTRIPQALKGEVPHSEVSDAEIGSSFYDDGENVYFAMRNHEEYKENRYQYSWKTNQVTAWNPPVEPEQWSGFISSEDRVYQIYWNGGLYKGTERILEMPFSEHWLGSTHKLVMSIPPDNLERAPIKKAGLHLYDVDTGESRQILQTAHPVLGTSKDGKWIYLNVTGPLQ